MCIPLYSKAGKLFAEITLESYELGHDSQVWIGGMEILGGKAKPDSPSCRAAGTYPPDCNGRFQNSGRKLSAVFYTLPLPPVLIFHTFSIFFFTLEGSDFPRDLALFWK